MANSRKLVFRRAAQIGLLCVAIFAFLGAGDENARFNDLGHRMMCVCGCNQILLECNHVGCNYSDHMREELIAAINHGDNDDLVLQAFIQKYGTTVLAAPTSKGFNRVAWTMPYAVLVLGLGVVTMIVRAWGRKAVALREAAGPTDPAMEPFRDQAQRETEL
jgi:cytochrome c-type biogenesis protein CcmH/NrfF